MAQESGDRRKQNDADDGFDEWATNLGHELVENLTENMGNPDAIDAQRDAKDAAVVPMTPSRPPGPMDERQEQQGKNGGIPAAD